jgi:hypothetical protein
MLADRRAELADERARLVSEEIVVSVEEKREDAAPVRAVSASAMSDPSRHAH